MNLDTIYWSTIPKNGSLIDSPIDCGSVGSRDQRLNATLRFERTFFNHQYDDQCNESENSRLNNYILYIIY